VFIFMIFHCPEMLLLLAIVPMVGTLLARAQKKQAEAAAKLRGERSFSNQWKNPIVLRLASLAALILALAQPAWNPHPGPAGMQGRDLVIALDISRSMLAQDVFPSRLGAAKIAVFESLDHLRGQRIGLITFAGAASVRVPLTLDHNFVRYMLDRAQPSDADVGSTSLQSAIEKAIDVVLKESKKGQQDLIILTDGEDLLSDEERMAEELRDCGARVLIAGLGDPLAGARIPDLTGTNQWMQYKGEDVITVLDEEKLKRLSAESPNVTYVPVQNKPFDLISIYRQMLADTQGIPGTESGQTIYTEGYPFLIALALLFGFFPINKRLLPILTALFMAGCSPDFQGLEKEYAQHIDQGRALWTEAQRSVGTDPRTALPALTTARDEFLRAALIRPGDQAAAQQIAGVSAQIRQAEAAIEEQQKAEEDLQKKLQDAIEKLAELTRREAALSQQSQHLLRRRPPAPADERAAAAAPSLDEQTRVGEGTGDVLNTVTEIQAVIQKILKSAYGGNEASPPTEFDEPVNKLAAARSEQQSAVENLQPDAVRWPQANSSLLTATRRMQEALALLSNQSKGSGSVQDSEEGDEPEWDFDEDAEWNESDGPGDMSMPMSSRSFKTALESRSLPSPNYTAEEILTEEAANMEQRAQQKEKSAGAKVEKNW
jgi:Ca-activated chloride channel homolog